VTLAALMYVEPAHERAVVFAYRLPVEAGEEGPVRQDGLDDRLSLSGLDPSASYDVHTVDLRVDPAVGPAEVWTADDLCGGGLAWAVGAPRTPAIWLLSMNNR
jgi:hypothetical protein